MCALNDDIWTVDRDELMRELHAYEEEFNIDTWYISDIDHFLEVKFHLIRGYKRKKHTDTICLLLTEMAGEQ